VTRPGASGSTASACHAAAAGFGVPVSPDTHWDAYLSVKAIRDIASGLFIAILMFGGSVHLLGWLILAATVIPLADALIVRTAEQRRRP